MLLSNKVYDVLKWITLYFLPGAGTLYFAISKIWGLPYGEEILGTLAAVIAFLGAVLGISSLTYKGDGELKIDTTNPIRDTYRMELFTPVEDLSDKKTVTFKVNTDDNLPSN